MPVPVPVTLIRDSQVIGFRWFGRLQDLIVWLCVFQWDMRNSLG